MRKSDFDLTDPAVVLRLFLGLGYLPHILSKLQNMAGSAAFFGKVLPYPELFLYAALAAETVSLLGLTFNILVKWVGLVSTGVMAIAVYAIFATKGVGWMWNLGGVEYLVLWGLGSFALAVQAWKRELATYGRPALFSPRAQPA